MPSIGSFSTAVREADEAVEPLTFEYNGEEFTLGDHLPALPFMRLYELGKNGASADDPESIITMFAVLRGCMKDEAEYARFEKAASREDGGVLFDICDKVIEGLMSRPTSPSSDSSDGRSKSSKRSSKQSGKRVSTANVGDELSAKRAANESAALSGPVHG